MPEEFGLDQRFRKLGQINGYKGFGKTDLKPLFSKEKGDEARTANGHGGRSFAGTGLTQDQCGSFPPRRLI